MSANRRNRRPGSATPLSQTKQAPSVTEDKEDAPRPDVAPNAHRPFMPQNVHGNMVDGYYEEEEELPNNIALAIRRPNAVPSNSMSRPPQAPRGRNDISGMLGARPRQNATLPRYQSPPVRRPQIQQQPQQQQYALQPVKNQPPAHQFSIYDDDDVDQVPDSRVMAKFGHTPPRERDRSPSALVYMTPPDVKREGGVWISSAPAPPPVPTTLVDEGKMREMCKQESTTALLMAKEEMLPKIAELSARLDALSTRLDVFGEINSLRKEISTLLSAASVSLTGAKSEEK